MFHVKQGNWFKNRGKCAIISNIRKIGKDPEGCRNMGRIIAITNQKGGVGKTTTAVNLSAALGQLGKRVLLIDIDPQGNATSGLGVNKRDIPSSTYDLIIAAADVKDVIRKTPYENVDILPSNIELAGAEIELVELDHRESRLKRAIAPVVEQYDYILIDCPPSLGLITLNGLTACGSILVPIQCEYYALEGLSQLIATVRQVKRLYNPRIEIEGVLLTRRSRNILPTRFTPPPFPGMCGCRRLPALASRWPILTGAPREPRPMKNWPKRYWNSIGSRGGKTWQEEKADWARGWRLCSQTTPQGM